MERKQHMNIHEINTSIQNMIAIRSERKPFHICKYDKKYCVGDIVHFNFNPSNLKFSNRYTGDDDLHKITYVLNYNRVIDDENRDIIDGIKKGYCILGIKKLIIDKQ